MKLKRLWAGGFAILLLASGSPITAAAATQSSISQATDQAVRYTQGRYEQKRTIAVDDWALIGLVLSGEKIGQGKWGTEGEWDRELQQRFRALDQRKTTDYARFVLTLVAADKDPSSFAGSDLLTSLKKAQLANGKFADSIEGEGQSLINAHVWSIIALHAAGEQVPRAKLAKSWLVSKQLPDGGFQFETGAKQGGVDMTSMTLIAFRALNMSKDEVPVKKALQFLRKSQGANGGFQEAGSANSESAANVISALLAWGEEPQAWKKENGNPVDNLLSYQKADGSFTHTKGGMSNSIATSQALLALSDLKRHNSYLSFLREKRGNKKLSNLSDLSANYWAYKEISHLVRNGYMQGVTPSLMKPDSPVTRAQFAALLLRAVGEEPNSRGQGLFADVPVGDWAAPIVEKASALGLMQGSNGKFHPHQGITHEEMTVIASRVAKRYGWMKTYTGAITTSVPWKEVSGWAEASVKDLQSRKLLGGTKSKRFAPKAPVTRAEAAVMLARLLTTR